MTALQTSSQHQLRQFIEQIERLDDERKGLCDDIKDKFSEAKSAGFDVKAMRKVIRMRKQNKTDRDEEEAILETYMAALGMLGDYADTALGSAYLDREFPDRVKA
jgi:uncharacterized protein (UPF0335 family)